MQLDQRILSLYIMHLTVVIFTLGNSITWTGVWPYLNVVSVDLNIFVD